MLSWSQDKVELMESAAWFIRQFQGLSHFLLKKDVMVWLTHQTELGEDKAKVREASRSLSWKCPVVTAWVPPGFTFRAENLRVLWYLPLGLPIGMEERQPLWKGYLPVISEWWLSHCIPCSWETGPGTLISPGASPCPCPASQPEPGGLGSGVPCGHCPPVTLPSLNLHPHLPSGSFRLHLR